MPELKDRLITALGSRWASFRASLDRSAPPDTRAHADELRSTVRNLPPLEDTGKDAKSAWQNFLKNFRRHIQQDDPDHFLRWEVINDTMNVSNRPSAYQSWKTLRRDRDWNRWKRSLTESPVGDPIPFALDHRTSANQVWHTFHLCQFLRETGMDATASKLVVEFGGGYGSMCRQLHRLGFAGRYIIFDLPEFGCLQRFYLKSLGIPVIEGTSFDGPQGVMLLSDLSDLQRVLQSCGGVSPSLFIATWSMSEAPLELRSRFLPLIERFDGFLLGYQDRFEGIDNGLFFSSWTSSVTGVKWMDLPLNILPGNHYLFGSALPAPSTIG